MSIPTDDDLLFGTGLLLRAHGINPTRGEAILLHNALAAGQFEQFEEVFGIDVSADFCKARPTSERVIFADEELSPKLDRVDLRKIEKPTEVFIEAATIRQIMPELLLSGKLLQIREFDDGVLADFVSELGANVFKATCIPRFSATSRVEESLKTPHMQESQLPHEKQHSVSAEESEEPQEKINQQKKVKGEFFPSKLFLQLKFANEMSLDDIRATFLDLNDFDSLHMIYRRDDLDYVILFKENDSRVQFCEKWSGSEAVSTKWLKVQDFIQMQQEYVKVWQELEEH